ncbi:DUF1871 family protein [Anaeromicropila herbilytica]|uniref:DUF1871 domain-containing protein n=1 Tax=Anaeromicropila herbilytica TaxID=2785025 RepID=A0A7R7IDB0_9FIRM|nr:DUF1871 family protein [Anaeromicropila herbilytica]BCN30859.1 hypothetical protein bsdtb5_21540 [Anaeromicropila herbilytica]
MKGKVNDIINNWDPIDLFPYSPKDEYEIEVNLIVNLSNETRNTELLANKIKHIFSKRFGEDVFLKSYEECLEIAKKIVISN